MVNVDCSRWIVQLRLNLGSPMARAGRLHTATPVMRNTRNVQKTSWREYNQKYMHNCTWAQLLLMAVVQTNTASVTEKNAETRNS